MQKKKLDLSLKKVCNLNNFFSYFNFQVFLEHAHPSSLTTQYFLFYISLSFKGEESKVALEGNEIDASIDVAEDRADLISGSQLAIQVNATEIDR